MPDSAGFVRDTEPFRRELLRTATACWARSRMRKTWSRRHTCGPGGPTAGSTDGLQYRGCGHGRHYDGVVKSALQRAGRHLGELALAAGQVTEPTAPRARVLRVDVPERPKREFRGCHGLDAVVDAMRSNYGL